MTLAKARKPLAPRARAPQHARGAADGVAAARDTTDGTPLAEANTLIAEFAETRADLRRAEERADAAERESSAAKAAASEAAEAAARELADIRVRAAAAADAAARELSAAHDSIETACSSARASAAAAATIKHHPELTRTRLNYGELR